MTPSRGQEEKEGMTVYSEGARIGGTLVWYWSICARQVWLMARGVEPNPKDEYLSLGRLLDQNSYARERHQLTFGDNKFDFMQSGEGGSLVVCEVKKSSRAEASARRTVRAGGVWRGRTNEDVRKFLL